jgi:hypothetical protein
MPKARFLTDAEAIEKFFDSIHPEPNTGCWLWGKGGTTHGYGGIKINGKSQLAHRFSYRVFRGDIPEKHLVCHKCDVRVCVNPDHLFIGTIQDNSRDMVNKGRQVRGEGTGISKLTDDAVRSILISRERTYILARKYGVHPTVISRTRRGLAWRHITAVATTSCTEGAENGN